MDKRCGKCKRYLSVSDFHRDVHTRTGLSSACKYCRRANFSAWNKVNRANRLDKKRNEVLHRLYGIGQEGYNRLFLEQNRKCAICGIESKLYVDHNHMCCPNEKSCGRCIRGLLCKKCNMGLGLLREKFFVEASCYLAKPPIVLKTTLDRPCGRRFERYKISEQQLEHLKQLVNGLCEICKSNPVYAIDHDHKCCYKQASSCGKCIRGLLCTLCNTGLAMFKHSTTLLLSAQSYVSKYRRDNVP